jgi:mannosyltransferase
MGGVVASTYLLARRFMHPPVAVAAASVCALLPRATWMAIEGRSWAFSALAAVVATLLLVDWVSTARRRLLFGYAVAIAIGIALNIYVVFLVAGHALSLLLVRLPRRRWWLWAGVAAFASAAASPVILAASAQRRQLGERVPVSLQDWLGSVFLRQFALGDTPGEASTLVPRWAWSGAAIAIAGLCWGLAVWWGSQQARTRGRDQTGALLWIGPWLVVAPVVAFGMGLLGSNLYHPRYFGFLAPAFAIAVGAGLASLNARRVRVLVAVVLVALTIPVFVSQREVFAKSGYDWSVVAELTQRSSASGDGVYFADTPSMRVVAAAYPDQFAGLRDLTMVQTPADEGSLDGTSQALTTTLLVSAPNRVVAIWSVRAATAESDRAAFAASGYREADAWSGPQSTVILFER